MRAGHVDLTKNLREGLVVFRERAAFTPTVWSLCNISCGISDIRLYRDVPAVETVEERKLSGYVVARQIRST
jgi:hypothetical protein